MPCCASCISSMYVASAILIQNNTPCITAACNHCDPRGFASEHTLHINSIFSKGEGWLTKDQDNSDADHNCCDGICQAIKKQRESLHQMSVSVTCKGMQGRQQSKANTLSLQVLHARDNQSRWLYLCCSGIHQDKCHKQPMWPLDDLQSTKCICTVLFARLDS